MTTATWAKAMNQPAPVRPTPSRINPMTMGPTKPPPNPSMEWTASVAPRRAGSALPAAPAEDDDGATARWSAEEEAVVREQEEEAAMAPPSEVLQERQQLKADQVAAVHAEEDLYIHSKM